MGLKVYVPQDGAYGLEPEEGGAPVEEETCYLKSDADRYIRRLKRKRCLAIAEYWGLVTCCTRGLTQLKVMRHQQKWLKLADKFKDEKL